MLEKPYYLVCYDVTNDKRRNKIYKILMGFGARFQYSVFIIPLNKKELMELRIKLLKAMKTEEDSILFVFMGQERNVLTRKQFILGKPIEFLSQSYVI